MTFDLMDHQEGDQQAQQCGDSESKEETHGDLEEEVKKYEEGVTTSLTIDSIWACRSLRSGGTSTSHKT